LKPGKSNVRESLSCAISIQQSVNSRYYGVKLKLLIFIGALPADIWISGQFNNC